MPHALRINHQLTTHNRTVIDLTRNGDELGRYGTGVGRPLISADRRLLAIGRAESTSEISTCLKLLPGEIECDQWRL